LETEIIPDLADYMLSDESIQKLLLSRKEEFLSVLKDIVQSQEGKPKEWYAEANRWIERIEKMTDNDACVSERLKLCIEMVYSELTEGSKASAIIDRIREEANLREKEYSAAMDRWESECEQIEEDNIPIREHNRKREEIKLTARKQYESEMLAYEEKVLKYNNRLNDETDQHIVEKPEKPTPLEARLMRIDEQYPHKDATPPPPKPQKPESTKLYSTLNSLLAKIVS
jgi:PHD/YefM family antitoxin component YafN of YafNO toxin-antitoxin module